MDEHIVSPRFPDQISLGSTGGPGFKTFIFEGGNALDHGAVTQWDISRGKWDISKALQDLDDMDDVREFFYAARGKARTFRFKDWHDYTLDNEQIGVGDGADTTFQLIKTYGTTNPYIRTIYKPVTGTVVVRVNGVIATQSVNVETGLVTMTSAPILASLITATCEFDCVCRFDTDELQLSLEVHDMASTSIPLVEVLPF